MNEEFFVSLSDDYFSKFHCIIENAKFLRPIASKDIPKYNLVIRKILIKYIELLQASWETVRDDTSDVSLTIKQLVIITGSLESQSNTILNHLCEDLQHKVPHNTFLSFIPLTVDEISAEWNRERRGSLDSPEVAISYLQAIMTLVIFSYGCHVILAHSICRQLRNLLTFLQEEYTQFHIVGIDCMNKYQLAMTTEIVDDDIQRVILPQLDLFVRIDTSKLPQKLILSPWYMHW
jgi:hypothetical protein